MNGRKMSEPDYELLLQEAAEQISLAHPSGIDLLLNNAGMQEPITRASETYASTCPMYNADQLAADLFHALSCALCCTLHWPIYAFCMMQGWQRICPCLDNKCCWTLSDNKTSASKLDEEEN